LLFTVFGFRVSGFSCLGDLEFFGVLGFGFQAGFGFLVSGLQVWEFLVLGGLGFRFQVFLSFWVFRFCFSGFGFQGFRVSGFQGFRVSGFQDFRVSGFQGFRVSGFRALGLL
jgi:hypothetical protein